MVNVALMLERSKKQSILLYTYYPFTEKSCQIPILKILNQEKSILSLKTKELYPDKLQNFYNCTLMTALWNVAPYLTIPAKGKNLKDIKGMEGFLLNVLAEVLKFDVDFRIPPNNEQRGLVKADGTVTGAIKMVS